MIEHKTNIPSNMILQIIQLYACWRYLCLLILHILVGSRSYRMAYEKLSNDYRTDKRVENIVNDLAYARR